MSKKKSRNQRKVRHSRKAKKPQAAPKAPRKPRRVVKAIASAILALMGLLSVVTYLPRLTIDPGVVLDPCNPLKTTFRISNDGYFSVSRIRYKFAMLHLVSTSETGLDVRMHGRNVFVMSSDVQIPLLQRNEKASLVCPPTFTQLTQDTSQCEIEIVVEYRPFIWPLTKERRYRFEARMDSNRHWQWIEKATSEQY